MCDWFSTLVWKTGTGLLNQSWLHNRHHGCAIVLSGNIVIPTQQTQLCLWCNRFYPRVDAIQRSINTCRKHIIYWYDIVRFRFVWWVLNLSRTTILVLCLLIWDQNPEKSILRDNRITQKCRDQCTPKYGEHPSNPLFFTAIN